MENEEAATMLARVDERTKSMKDALDDFIDAANKRLDSHDVTIGCHDRDIAVIKDRMTVAHAIQATLTVVGSSIAAFLGMNK